MRERANNLGVSFDETVDPNLHYQEAQLKSRGFKIRYDPEVSHLEPAAYGNPTKFPTDHYKVLIPLLRDGKGVYFDPILNLTKEQLEKVKANLKAGGGGNGNSSGKSLSGEKKKKRKVASDS
jgi:hypothetical protein